MKKLFVYDEALFYSLLLGGLAWVLVFCRIVGVINKGIDNLMFIGLLSSVGIITGIVGARKTERKRLGYVLIIMNLVLPLWLGIFTVASMVGMRGMH